MRAAWGIMLLVWGGLAYAAPEISPRPLARATALTTNAVPSVVRPVSGHIITTGTVDLASVNIPMSPRPLARSRASEQKVMGKRRQPAKGAICGETALQGDVVGFVPGKLEGCGIRNAVRIRAVSGIPLSQPAILDCKTSQALRKWVDGGLTPALKSRGKVAQINVASHYSCRTRNNQQGARISEHGKGRAIDISGFVMQGYC